MKMKLSIAVALAFGGICSAQTLTYEEEWRSRLAENTRQLAKAFEKKDKAEEEVLYKKRDQILIGLRDSKPKSAEPARILKGVVEYKMKREITIRTSPKEGVTVEIGKIQRPQIQKIYDAIGPGDKIELHFTQEAQLYGEGYSWELTKIVTMAKKTK